MSEKDSPLFELQAKILAFDGRLSSLEQRIAKLEGQVDLLVQQANTTNSLIKYVITPLIVGVLALVGIKLTLP